QSTVGSRTMEERICEYQACGMSFRVYPSQRKGKKAYCSREGASKDKAFRFHNEMCGCGQRKDFRAKQCAACAPCGYSKGALGERVSDEAIQARLAFANSFSSVAQELCTPRKRVARVARDRDVSLNHLVRGRGRPAISATTLVLHPWGRNSNAVV